jgi:hypothetical protein
LLLFGGYDVKQKNLNDTWEWDGSRWSQKLSSVNPSARDHHAMATLGSKLFLFGGYDLNQKSLNDSWERDDSSWSQKPLFDGTPTRRDRATSRFR